VARSPAGRERRIDEAAKIADGHGGQTCRKIKYLAQLVKPVPECEADSQGRAVGRSLEMRPLVSFQEVKVNTKKLIRDHEVEVDEVSGFGPVFLGGNGTTIPRPWRKTGSTTRSAAICGAGGLRGKTPELLAHRAQQGFTPDYWRQLAEGSIAYHRKPLQHLGAENLARIRPRCWNWENWSRKLLQPLIEGGQPSKRKVVIRFVRRWPRQSRTFFTEDWCAISQLEKKLCLPHPW